MNNETTSGQDSVKLTVGNGAYMLRFEKPPDKLLPIQAEYAGIGFDTLGGTIFLRSFEHQIAYIRSAYQAGLIIAMPLFYVENEGVTKLSASESLVTEPLTQAVFEAMSQRSQSAAMLFPFVAGVPISEFLSLDPSLPNANFRKKGAVVRKQILEIQTSHTNKLVTGDRWGPNQIVSTGADQEPLQIIHIDIDLDITREKETNKFNPYSMHFEMAQVLYHLVYWTHESERRKMIAQVISPLLIEIKKQYNIEIIYKLLLGHKKFFDTYDQQYSFQESGYLLNLIKIY